MLLSSHQWPLFSRNFPLVCISKHVAFTFWLIKYWITIQRNICEAASSHFWDEYNKLLLINSSFCIDLWCYLWFFFFSVWKWSLFLTWCAGYYFWRYLVSFCWGMSHQEIRKRCHTSHTYNDLKDLKLILCKSKFYYFSGYCECCISFTWNWLPNSSICSTFNHQWLQGKFSTKLMNHEPVCHRWSMTP